MFSLLLLLLIFITNIASLSFIIIFDVCAKQKKNTNKWRKQKQLLIDLTYINRDIFINTRIIIVKKQNKIPQQQQKQITLK